ncbi:hypothetical protein CASFOL_006328 [Castilleja foliolosa]|uniref:VTT domain-containing protein n=1 Tax=Castilleja foliolosa TaxID=1961234 RepID=A0ABD3E624_9LAMI
MGRRWAMAAAVALAGVVLVTLTRNQLDDSGNNNNVKQNLMNWLREMCDRLGYWAIPAYVGVHTLTLALCLPYAVFFEAGASMFFGFLPALLCVFSAKILGASLSFWIGRLVFRNSGSAVQWVHKNKYFHLLSKGVERDGWKFVLLARFSPLPSYIINYALAATNVRFLVDFLLPTVIGCIPMILQNTSIGSLASAAVASASGSQKSQGPSFWTDGFEDKVFKSLVTIEFIPKILVLVWEHLPNGLLDNRTSHFSKMSILLKQELKTSQKLTC